MAKLLLALTGLMTLASPAMAQTGTAPQGAQPAPQPIARTALLQLMDRDFAAVDANKDGFADRAELAAAEGKAMSGRKAAMLRQREAAFHQLDGNRDGSLTLQEFNAQAAATPLPAPNATPTLNRFDTNKDGKISLAENRAVAMAEFDRADANRDGTLSVEEQRARANR